MRALVLSGASSPTLWTLTPLVAALRNEGHDVLVATTDELRDVAVACGHPFVTVTTKTLKELLFTARDGSPVEPPATLGAQERFAGNWFGRLAAATLPSLNDLTAVWRPDVVIGGTSCYAAPILATRLGVPAARMSWDALEAYRTHPFAAEELRPELAELGLDTVPEPELYLDICPPSLRDPDAPVGAPMRYVPSTAQKPSKLWMLQRSTRPRVCLTAGSRASIVQQTRFLKEVADAIGPDLADVVIAGPEATVAPLRASLPHAHVGWFPLDVLATTVDVIVHHGGGTTSMVAMSAGTPQVVVPSMELFGDSWARLEDAGAAAVTKPGIPTADNIAGTPPAAEVAEACSTVLSNASYGVAARLLADEIDAMPSPAARVADLTALAPDHARPAA